MQNLLWIAAALAAGVCLPLQAGINAKLAANLGGTIQAALISFVVGTLGLIALVMSLNLEFPLKRAWEQGQWWHFGGGLLGVYFVCLVVVLGPRLGALAMLGLIVVGQTVASLIFDHFGLLGFPLTPISFTRILGVLFLAAGVLLVRA